MTLDGESPSQAAGTSGLLGRQRASLSLCHQCLTGHGRGRRCV